MIRTMAAPAALVLMAVLTTHNTSESAPDPFQAVPTGGIILSEAYRDETLTRAGFSLAGEMPGSIRYSQVPRTSVSAGRWVPTYLRGNSSQPSAPDPGEGLSVWTGEKMLVYQNGVLFSYDPATDLWAHLGASTVRIANTANREAVWTGTEMVIWGGNFSAPADGGVRYNPSTNTWAAMASPNQPSARSNFTMIWAANRVIVWGGERSGATLGDGAMYDPAANAWTTINAAGAPTARRGHTAVWSTETGNMVVWGGSSTVLSAVTDQLNTGAFFNPAKNVWTGPTQTSGAPAARMWHTANWSGTEMIVFGGWDYAPHGASVTTVALNTGGKFDPATNTWRPTSATGAPYTSHHSAVWTGSALLVTGGHHPNMPMLGRLSATLYGAHLYDPAANTWRNAGDFNSSDPKLRHQSYLAGDMVLIWGGSGYNEATRGNPASNTGYRYFLRDGVTSVTQLFKGNTVYLYRKN